MIYQNRKNEHPLYEDFAKRIGRIIGELSIEKINYAIIESRAKTVENFRNSLEEYGSHERNDLAVISVVGYVKSDVNNIVEVIKKMIFILIKTKTNLALSRIDRI